MNGSENDSQKTKERIEKNAMDDNRSADNKIETVIHLKECSMRI